MKTICSQNSFHLQLFDSSQLRTAHSESDQRRILVTYFYIFNLLKSNFRWSCDIELRKMITNIKNNVSASEKSARIVNEDVVNQRSRSSMNALRFVLLEWDNSFEERLKNSWLILDDSHSSRSILKLPMIWKILSSDTNISTVLPKYVRK